MMVRWDTHQYQKRKLIGGIEIEYVCFILLNYTTFIPIRIHHKITIYTPSIFMSIFDPKKGGYFDPLKMTKNGVL